MQRPWGFETWCFFMFGLLGETRETIEQTIRFAIELDPDVSKFHIVKPYPGSEFHQELKQLGLIREFDPERYSIHTYPVHRTEDLDFRGNFPVPGPGLPEILYAPAPHTPAFPPLEFLEPHPEQYGAGVPPLEIVNQK